MQNKLKLTKKQLIRKHNKEMNDFKEVHKIIHEIAENNFKEKEFWIKSFIKEQEKNRETTSKYCDLLKENKKLQSSKKEALKTLLGLRN